MATKVVVSFEVDNAGAVRNLREVKRELVDTEAAGERAAGGMTRFSDGVRMLGAALAAAGVIRFMRDFVQLGKESARASMEQQQIFTNLAGSIQGAGLSFDEVKGDLDALFATIQRFTKYGDTDTAQALETITTLSGDAAASLKILEGTLNFASARNMELGTAAEQMGRALAGSFETLTRYGITLDANTSKMLKMADEMERAEIFAALLEEKWGGRARQEMEGYSARLQQLGNYFGDVQEALGDLIIGMFDSEVAFSTTRDLLLEIEKTLKELGSATKGAAVGIAAVANAVGSLVNVIRSHQNEISLFINLLGIMVSEKIERFAYYMNQVAATVTLISKGMSPDSALAMVRYAAAKGVDISARFDMIASHASTATEQVDALVKKLGDGGGTGGGLVSVSRELTSTLGELEARVAQAFTNAAWALEDYNNAVVDEIIDRWGEIPEEIEQIVDSAVIPTFEDMAEKSSSVLEGTFSDLLGKGFMGELESFADLWDAVWQDLAKSMVGIIGDAFEQLLKGTGGLGGIFDSLASQIAGMIAGLGMVIQGYQTGGTGGAVMGALGGAMAGAALGSIIPGIGTLIGGIVGGALGLIGGLLGGSDDPETLVQRLGLDTGQMLTRGHQGIGPEMRELWIKQQQGIMRSYIKSYREILRMFEDQSLFELIGQTPTFSTTGWQGIGANDLAKYLEQEFWPTAFMNMFRDAISAGLEGFGVTSGTIDQLWRELEDLPGADRMGALSTYVSGLVNLSNLMADMDWNAILDAVGMDSMQQFMHGVDGVTAAIESLMFSMGDMSLLERAEQAAQIEQLITQVRQAEIQYLQQLDQLQRGINQSIDQQLEQLYVGGLSGSDQRFYYQQRIAEIMGVLAGGDVTSPEQLQQLMSDLQRYIGALSSSLGDQLFETIAPWGGETWAEYLSGILEQARGFSDEYFEQFRTEIREVNERLIETLEELILALTDFGAEVGAGPGGGGGPDQIIVQPQVDVYVDGSIAALRPIIRAEIRDAMARSSAPIS